jgi:phosphoribosylformimino-5-aminoimidazole carboxamide ribotide isomerase
MFRPCIDLREGRVVQIVGGTLSDQPDADTTVTNFSSDKPAEWFAAKYRSDNLTGGHIIKLGPGNDEAALSALSAWPGGMQVGGGINDTNAVEWLDAGASHVVVTSHLFIDGEFSPKRLSLLVDVVGKDRLVIDLSCRWHDGAYWVVTDRWQHFTSLKVDAGTLDELAHSCAEFLVHGVDVEGLSQGIDLDLVTLLAESCPIPCTYAGGARSLADLQLVHDTSHGRIDLTIGSALDIFGGTGVTYSDCVAFNGRLLS